MLTNLPRNPCLASLHRYQKHLADVCLSARTMVRVAGVCARAFLGNMCSMPRLCIFDMATVNLMSQYGPEGHRKHTAVFSGMSVVAARV
jgi:hypothetical protein